MDELRATMRAFTEAYGNADAERVAEMYAEDALYLIPDMEILKGRAAIRAYLAGWTGGKADFKQELVELKIEGDLAYEVTNQLVTIEGKDQPTRVLPNKFVHVWKRQNDGTWQVLIDMWNSRPEKK